ncbi:MAG: hypothetical protein F2793_03510 [Actinobacteria bacterium]|uniref:Unannotated protein n=1 Tax=freshwater metagenome TaxID=449393 RepID=A0A6J7DKU8_9ZZZZ|nr:hypothetical protein [Actinomycetota bacterium]
MRNSKIVAGLTATVALVALAGCSSGSSTAETAAPAASASASPSKAEDLRTTDAAVAVGMKAIDALVTQIAAAPAAQGKTLSEGIEPLWKPIEGTVQANSQETYDAYEGGFTLLESGDATKAAEGAKAVTDATAAYLTNFPG